MTFPTPPELPKNVLASSDLGTEMQNLNPTKVKAKSQANMCPGFLGSGGGLAAGVVTTVGNLFGTFMGNIADDASSVTVESPEDVEEQVEDFFDTPASKLFDFFLGFLSPILQGVTSGLSGAALALANIFSGKWSTLEDIEEVQVPRLDNRIDSLAGIGTRSTFYASGTWPNPGKGIAAVAVFNGGKPGGDDGGEGSRYLYQEFNCEDLPSSVTVTVGGSNVASSFGSFLVGSWTVGGVVTAQGILTADNDAGHGGAGHDGSSGTSRISTAGESTYWATGGARGTSGAGGAGGDAPIDRITVVGGGGGGGGGYTGGVGFILGKDGGDGGWPGGGGGGRGQGNVGDGTAGLGGYGGVFVTVQGG